MAHTSTARTSGKRGLPRQGPEARDSKIERWNRGLDRLVRYFADEQQGKEE